MRERGEERRERERTGERRTGEKRKAVIVVSGQPASEL